MGPKIDPKWKKNGIEKQSDFKTKLHGRISGIDPRTLPGQAPLGASHMRVHSLKEEINQNIKRLQKHPCIALWCGNNEVDVAWHNWGWQRQFGYNSLDSTTIWKGHIELFENIISIARTGIAILMVEQNARQALEIADNGFVLVQGENKYTDKGSKLLSNKEVRKAFLGG